MKLSEKGIETIFSALLKTIEERDLVFRQISQGVFKKHVEALEFESDDFDGCCQNGNDHLVCLTVEEAEKLMKLLDLCEYWLTNNNVSYDCDAWASLLEERIEQAEKKK